MAPLTRTETGRLSRRQLFVRGGSGLAAAVAAPHALFADGGRGLRVKAVDRFPVELPFREIPARNMARELPHWKYFEILRVRLRSGEVGYGETLLFYTWGRTADRDVKRVRGKNAAAMMWDDSLGAGLQMALFDAVGRATGVPIHRLLGKKIHEKTPLSWWDIDLPPADLAAECRAAHKQGYRALKTKGRPWFDIWKQAEAVSTAVPDAFEIDFDFNSTLHDADRAIPVLKDLASYPQIGVYETPIPQSDVEGNKKIRHATDVDIAMHYGTPPPMVAARENVCDGFVVSGGARRLMRQGAVAASIGMPFWLQIVGSDLTAAYSLHFGGVLDAARWPAVNCHQLYAESLLTEPIAVKQGHAKVPDTPGLGFDINMDAVRRLSTEKPSKRPEPRRLIKTTWPDGRTMYVANTGEVDFMLKLARKGRIPFFERGVETQLVPDDGTERWEKLYRRARKGPLLMNDGGDDGSS